AYTELLIEGWKGHHLRVQSTTVDENLFILITPQKISSVQYQLEIPIGFLWNTPGSVLPQKGHILARYEQDSIMIHTTATVFEPYQLYTTPYLAIKGSEEPIAVYTGDKRSLSEIQKILRQAELDYHMYANRFGEYAEGFKAIQAVLGWNTIYDPSKERVISPVSRAWNKAWQGHVLFNWDTYLASLLFALDNKELAYSNAIAVTAYPHESGNIGHYQMADGTVSLMSQPPIGSTICWMLYERYRDRWFLEEVFDQLLAWNHWWPRHRMLQDGYLTWGGWKGASAQIAAWESGLDNSPMYEDLKMIETKNASLLQLADVGLQSLYVLDCQSLIKMANVLGKNEVLEELRKKEKKYKKLTRTLWDESKSSYLNKDLARDGFSDQKSPTLFYPMIANIPSKSQANEILQQHYYNTEEFYGKYQLPSISFDNPKYDNIYWRGAIWPPMNFLVYLGLKNYSSEAAEELADKSYRLFMDAWRNHNAVFENINADLGVENVSDQLMADTYYHWGALMGIMKFMEEGYYGSED
ncbi:MAG: hypothetical protein KI790_10730, partial [Cyclobacteriaceae bacterium]|nr:hypothetical protein [Cyclobacteriaceae bacterium HetDA_MAG_MS6]